MKVLYSTLRTKELKRKSTNTVQLPNSVTFFIINIFEITIRI